MSWGWGCPCPLGFLLLLADIIKDRKNYNYKKNQFDFKICSITHRQQLRVMLGCRWSAFLPPSEVLVTMVGVGVGMWMEVKQGFQDSM